MHLSEKLSIQQNLSTVMFYQYQINLSPSNKQTDDSHCWLKAIGSHQ